MCRLSRSGLALVLVSLAACSSTSGGTGNPDGADAGGSSPNRDADGRSSPSDSPLSFVPSNVPIASSDARDDVVISARCELDTDQGTIRCDGRPDVAGFGFRKIDQGNGAGMVALFAMHSLRIEPSGVLRVSGSVPLILFSATVLDVLGGLDASSTTAGHAGGFISSSNGPGGGPGGGGGVSSHYNGGAGGTFCGVGGAGGVEVAPGLTAAGAYGSADVVPLFAGSAGGAGNALSLGGAGGGAVQLVAGSAAQAARSWWSHRA